MARRALCSLFLVKTEIIKLSQLYQFIGYKFNFKPPVSTTVAPHGSWIGIMSEGSSQTVRSPRFYQEICHNYCEPEHRWNNCLSQHIHLFIISVPEGCQSG